jgi:hypothetical protein
MSTIKARFDGRVFVPDGPVNLPVGLELEIPVNGSAAAEGSTASLLDLLAKLDELPVNEEWPPDGAEQHDHYLYGVPRRP